MVNVRMQSESSAVSLFTVYRDGHVMHRDYLFHTTGSAVADHLGFAARLARHLALGGELGLECSAAIVNLLFRLAHRVVAVAVLSRPGNAGGSIEILFALGVFEPRLVLFRAENVGVQAVGAGNIVIVHEYCAGDLTILEAVKRGHAEERPLVLRPGVGVEAAVSGELLGLTLTARGTRQCSLQSARPALLLTRIAVLEHALDLGRNVVARRAPALALVVLGGGKEDKGVGRRLDVGGESVKAGVRAVRLERTWRL